MSKSQGNTNVSHAVIFERKIRTHVKFGEIAEKSTTTIYSGSKG